MVHKMRTYPSYFLLFIGGQIGVSGGKGLLMWNFETFSKLGPENVTA